MCETDRKIPVPVGVLLLCFGPHVPDPVGEDQSTTQFTRGLPLWLGLLGDREGDLLVGDVISS